jgi:RNA recognition motif-containing protein
MKNIYVGNLGSQTTEEELRDLFARHGKVDQVSRPRDPATGRARGFAFVEMADDAEGERAIRELNGSTLGGRSIVVNEARPRAARAEPQRTDRERRFGRS